MRLLFVALCAISAFATHAASADPLTWGRVLTRTANGCDAFTPVRAADGHHYTSFGDCGGLTGKFAKLSMGFGRILGGPAGARVEDLRTSRIDGSGLVDYGDRDAGRKPSSAIIIGGRMFVWVRNYGPRGTQARLKFSDNFANSSNSIWIWAPVILTNFGYPVFVQGAPGDYVYIVAHDNNSAYRPANRFVLLRVPRTRLTDRSAYQFFNGTPSNPSWGQSYSGRKPIFTAPGKCYRSGMSYSRARGRYYWWQNNGASTTTNSFEVWSSSKPWGPWKRIFHTAEWDINPGERGEFPVAWMGSEPISRQGKLHLLFSGGDRLTIREATIAAGY
jgi:hypothetical protein